MGLYDSVTKQDPYCTEFGSQYSMLNMSPIHNIVSPFKSSFVLLDLLGCDRQNHTVFVCDIVHTMCEAHFENLETIRLCRAFVGMPKQSGLNMLETLVLCPTLRRVCLGDETKFK